MEAQSFAASLSSYKRRSTIEVTIGKIPLGGNNPIRIQSMTTVDTMDTIGSVEQCIRMIESGCEYIRITAPSIKEAENLKLIKDELLVKGYDTPLIADIHFTPNAAEVAATHIEKVRVNPGNYADKKKFDVIEYDDNSYAEELLRIKEKFEPLISICKENGTAIRIGTNHGSLSDRIMSRFGDTPNGMVESALEFLRICEENNFYECVISMKSSNPQVMVQAYRLLSARLKEEGMKSYPLHLGVTEAGEGEDGRIKSALGIGTLLEDGLGDTIRVSLTEDPEFEAPIAKILAQRYESNIKSEDITISPDVFSFYSPYEFKKRTSNEILNIGGTNVPRVITDFSNINIDKSTLKKVGHHYLPATDKWGMSDTGTDYIYSGKTPVNFMLPNGLKEIINFDVWNQLTDKTNKIPFGSLDQLKAIKTACFVNLTIEDILEKHIQVNENHTIVLNAKKATSYQSMRAAFLTLEAQSILNPVIIKREYTSINEEVFQLYASTDVGGLLIDGFGDGIWLVANEIDSSAINSTSFGILQAARTRMTKTEYISCPSCGRTLFDLQETTAKIRVRTDHLKGIKIGIMGCIVNGPGEMADADYGYVGSGKGKITLYKGQEVVKRGVPSEGAVDELIELIKTNGDWLEKA